MKDEKSKSAIKREALAMQDLAVNLAQLSTKQRSKLSLPPSITEAISQIKQTSSHVAKKRAIQRAASELRHIEADTLTAIQASYTRLMQSADLNSPQFRRVESWRARLLSADKEALTELIAQYPCEDVQQLRLFIRRAKSERDHQKNPGAGKALFRLLRDLIT